jgi:hypothetical protein
MQIEAGDDTMYAPNIDRSARTCLARVDSSADRIAQAAVMEMECK